MSDFRLSVLTICTFFGGLNLGSFIWSHSALFLFGAVVNLIVAATMLFVLGSGAEEK